MSYYHILKLLGLTQFNIDNIEYGLGEVIFYVSSRRKTADCPMCYKRTKYLHQYLPPQVKRHINIGKTKTFLIISKRRFRCHRCGQVFTETIKGIDKWQRQTHQLENWLLSVIALASFNQVTQVTQASYRCQQKVMEKYLQQHREQNPHWWQTEIEAKEGFVLGLDGHSFAGRDMVQTVTNLTHKRLLAVLPKDNQAALVQFLTHTMPAEAKKRVKAVCIDMTSGKKTVIHQYLPQADIIVDVFHLIADAIKRIDEERLVVQQMEKVKISKTLFFINKENLTAAQQTKLKYWFKRFPSLYILWFHKEALREMYQEAKTRKEAQEKLDKIINSLYSQRTRDTSRWARTLERWYDPILNYFIYRTTNAYTEGLHTKFKLIKRISYGFRNKQSYINKITLACLIVSTCLPQF
jgi:transposase